jgi:hypothetical protein
MTNKWTILDLLKKADQIEALIPVDKVTNYLSTWISQKLPDRSESINGFKNQNFREFDAKLRFANSS